MVYKNYLYLVDIVYIRINLIKETKNDSLVGIEIGIS